VGEERSQKRKIAAKRGFSMNRVDVAGAVPRLLPRGSATTFPPGFGAGWREINLRAADVIAEALVAGLGSSWRARSRGRATDRGLDPLASVLIRRWKKLAGAILRR
jgi:hypothetical protein